MYFGSAKIYLFWVLHRLRLPDLLTILTDCPVGRKLPHPGNIQNRHLGPILSVPICRTYPILALDVGLVVSQKQILVAVKKVVHEGAKQVPVTVGKFSCGN